MYQIKFNLKQHTPLIHFQGELENSTIRITELKPKFDRFILKYYLNDNDKYDNFINYKHLLTAYRKVDWEKVEQDQAKKRKYIDTISKAFNYKIRVISGSNIIDSKISKAYPNYLANMGSAANTDKNSFVFTDDIQIEFSTHLFSLIEIIESLFKDFICITNFGNRQSKGFGCFSTKEINQAEYEAILRKYYIYVYKTKWINDIPNPSVNHKILFNKIEKEYKILKAGDSQSKKESKLREYVNQLTPAIEWEKPKIKLKITEIIRKHFSISKNNENYKFVRAFLGLPDKFEYLKEKIEVKVKHLKDKSSLEVNNGEGECELEIKRFPSSIIFKVFEGSLYLSPQIDTMVDLIAKNKFELEFSQVSESRKIYKDKLIIETPIKFEIAEFLEVALLGSPWKRI